MLADREQAPVARQRQTAFAQRRRFIQQLQQQRHRQRGAAVGW